MFLLKHFVPNFLLLLNYNIIYRFNILNTIKRGYIEKITPNFVSLFFSANVGPLLEEGYLQWFKINTVLRHLYTATFHEFLNDVSPSGRRSANLRFPERWHKIWGSQRLSVLWAIMCGIYWARSISISTVKLVLYLRCTEVAVTCIVKEGWCPFVPRNKTSSNKMSLPCLVLFHERKYGICSWINQLQ